MNGERMGRHTYAIFSLGDLQGTSSSISSSDSSASWSKDSWPGRCRVELVSMSGTGRMLGLLLPETSQATEFRIIFKGQERRKQTMRKLFNGNDDRARVTFYRGEKELWKFIAQRNSETRTRKVRYGHICTGSCLRVRFMLRTNSRDVHVSHIHVRAYTRA